MNAAGAPRCVIAGGGPAGIMLGLLLARGGVPTTVLEKHDDFLRDFRGDTVHPSTLEVMHELDLLDEMLAIPHERASGLRAEIGEQSLRVADFDALPTRCGFIAFLPQWDLLSLLARRARALGPFELRMGSEVTGLLRQSDAFAGVRARTPDGGEREIPAELVVAADGRDSTCRAHAGLEPRDLGAPIDVLWFRIPKRADHPDGTVGRFGPGRILVRIDRGHYWQCGHAIPKGARESLEARGLDALRDDVAALLPFALPDDALASWSDVKTLRVQVNRLERWYRPGLLCIGDAAHAMSPVGGVGINLAIQDAVAAARRLVPALREGPAEARVLRHIQRRRQIPAWLTQRGQVLAHERVLAPVLERGAALRPPRLVRLLDRSPRLRRITGRILGLGILPEHVAPAPAPRASRRASSATRPATPQQVSR